jgi:methylthioribose-1-phosphate isomerase
MKVNGTHYYSVWASENENCIHIINQKELPFDFRMKSLSTIGEIINAIKTLEVRGAPAIGITAAYAVWLSYLIHHGVFLEMKTDYEQLIKCRPTAVNLLRGADFVYRKIENSKSNINSNEVFHWAQQFAEQEISACQNIGKHGFEIIGNFYKNKNKPVNILTHCNAGWLACGDYGTALAPIFEAKKRGVPMHVWVDETRPLNQGSRITAWELHNEHIPFSIISDNAGGLLMMNGNVDCVIVGADRIVRNGDVANKIGTYLKALAAKEHHIPFYVAAPVSTFDMSLKSGKDIPVEMREGKELQKITGLYQNELHEVSLFPDDFSSVNAAFDITPAKFISGYICEKGVITDKKQIRKLYDSL